MLQLYAILHSLLSEVSASLCVSFCLQMDELGATVQVVTLLMTHFIFLFVCKSSVGTTRTAVGVLVQQNDEDTSDSSSDDSD